MSDYYLEQQNVELSTSEEQRLTFETCFFETYFGAEFRVGFELLKVLGGVQICVLTELFLISELLCENGQS